MVEFLESAWLLVTGAFGNGLWLLSGVPFGAVPLVRKYANPPLSRWWRIAVQRITRRWPKLSLWFGNRQMRRAQRAKRPIIFFRWILTGAVISVLVPITLAYHDMRMAKDKTIAERDAAIGQREGEIQNLRDQVTELRMRSDNESERERNRQILGRLLVEARDLYGRGTEVDDPSPEYSQWKSNFQQWYVVARETIGTELSDTEAAEFADTSLHDGTSGWHGKSMDHHRHLHGLGFVDKGDSQIR